MHLPPPLRRMTGSRGEEPRVSLHDEAQKNYRSSTTTVPPPTWPDYKTKPGIPSIAHALPDYHVVAMHPLQGRRVPHPVASMMAVAVVVVVVAVAALWEH